MLSSPLLLLLALATAADPAAPLIPVNVILNGDFELIADSTTEPQKYGAYWREAFVPEPGVPTSRVRAEETGNHFLALAPGEPAVSQILTLYGPASCRFELNLRARGLDRGALVATLTTEGGRTARWRIGAGADEASRRPAIVRPDADGAGFQRVLLPIGMAVAESSGAAPAAWCRLELAADGAAVDVDDVVGAHWLPATRASELRASLLAEIRDFLRIFLAPPQGDGLAGLGLVDSESGYLVGGVHDVETGKVLERHSHVAIGGIHDLMVRYLRVADPAPEAAELRALVRDRLRKHVISVLKNNVYGPTGLYCLYDLQARQPILTAPLSPSHFIGYVLDVAALFPDDAVVQAYSVTIAARMAEAMLRLRSEHDLDRAVKFGRGPGGNWFGRMPEKVFPNGVLDQPKKSTYDQAWAISQNRSWYYDFQTSVGLMRVWSALASSAATDPARAALRDQLRAAVLLAIGKFDRKFDAQRYDMENDTDDHYGFNVESLLDAFRASGCSIPEIRDFAQAMTDYRLPRDLRWDENLWIEGIRLGSFTTGDQPRAFRGPVGLYRLAVEQNPLTAAYAPYRLAVRELAKGDLRRRLLDDGFFTEASSWQWEMISACFLGDYIAPCAKGLSWEGDMGDLFAGPAANGFRALARALEISRPGDSAEFIAWYAEAFEHTRAQYRRPYGYLFGMDQETGRRYKIPEKYLTGFSTTSSYGLASLIVHAELLESGALDVEPATVEVADVRRGADGGLDVALRGTPGRGIDVAASPNRRWRELGVCDWRLAAVAAEDVATRSAATVLAADGTATVRLHGLPPGRLYLDAVLSARDGRDIEAIATVEID